MAEFWRNIKPRRQVGLVSRFMRDLQSGFFELPRGFDVLTRYRTERLQLQHCTAPARLRPPEHKAMQQFYRLYPEAKLEPVALNTFDPPLAKQFALRQLQRLDRDRAAYQPQLAALRARLLSEGHRDNARLDRRVQAQRPRLTARGAARAVTMQMAADLVRIRQREVLVTGLEQVQHEEEEQMRAALQEAVTRSEPTAAGGGGKAAGRR